jgi:flagellar hook-associated protein 2
LTTALVTDLNNVSQLFSSEGTPSSANVTFIGFTEKTTPGSYDLRVSGGVPQISPAGQNQYVAAVGSGNFFAGADGTAAEGLNFRTAVLTNGSLGTIDLSIGVAELLNRELSFLTDTTRQGPLETELDTITKTIDEFNDTLFALDERLELFEQNIRSKFINLEINLGRLNTQKETFSMSLAGLQSLFAKK